MSDVMNNNGLKASASRMPRHVSLAGNPVGGSGPRASSYSLQLLLKGRLLSIVLVYTGCLIYAYVGYLNPIWGSLHYPAFDPSKSLTALTLSIVAIAGFAISLPTKITRYSHFVIWYLFYFLFAPSVLYVSLQGKEMDGGTRLVLHLVLSFAFIAFIPNLFSTRSQGGQQPFLPEEWNPRYGEVLHFPLLIVYIVCVASVLVVFGHMMRFPSFFEVYDHRAVAADLTGNRTFIAYLLDWLVRAIAPFMFAVGLMTKNRLYVGLALAAFAMAYAVSAIKFVPALIVLMLMLRHIVFSRRDVLAERLGLLVLGGLGVPLLIAIFYGALFDDTVDMMLGQSLHRVFGTPGTMIGHYSQFFSSHPLTYYSHIGAFRWFLEYPYGDDSIGQNIGYYLVQSTTYDANANFWAIDGIAALYHVGILIIGIVLGGVLTIFNTMSSPERLRLLCLSSVASVWMLVDGSLPRVLLGGGWFLHFVLVYFYFQTRDLPLGGKR